MADLLYPTLVICGLLGIAFVVAVGSSYLSLWWLSRRIGRCPKCGKRSAGDLVETRVTASRMQAEEPKAFHVFRRRAEGSIQIVENTYEDHYRCRHCGHQWIRTGRERKRAEEGEQKGNWHES